MNSGFEEPLLSQYSNFSCYENSVFFFLFSIASAETEVKPLTEANLNSYLGPNWRGIVYICDPFCRFISIKESIKWIPAIPDEGLVSHKLIKAISRTDPIYPLLIQQLPILPFVTQSAAGSKGSGQDENVETSPPGYSQMGFKYGWNLKGGTLVNIQNSKSDTSIERSFSPSTPVLGIQLSAELMKGEANKLLVFWIQQQIRLSIDTNASYQTEDLVRGQTLRREAFYQVLITNPDFKYGPRLGLLQESTVFGVDSIEHYSMSQSIIVGGLTAIFLKRWMFNIDTALTSQISEKQSFRQGPFAQDWYRVGLEYNSRNFSLFDISFGLTFGLSYQNDTQRAKLAENIYFNDQSNFSISSVTTKFLLRIGEDFNK